MAATDNSTVLITGANRGIGLELARAALTRMGGSLELADRGEGGAVARVFLPVAGGR